MNVFYQNTNNSFSKSSLDRNSNQNKKSFLTPQRGAKGMNGPTQNAGKKISTLESQKNSAYQMTAQNTGGRNLKTAGTAMRD